METIWFTPVAVMLTVFVVLDGFDYGAGILHLLVAKTDDERRMVLAAIGPVWDGNEVWLIASGGVLFFAFPRAYSAGFSGFYLPLMIALWLLIMRGLSIEFRSREPTFSGAASGTAPSRSPRSCWRSSCTQPKENLPHVVIEVCAGS